MTRYCITADIVKTEPNGSIRSVQVPTFFLLSPVQGIVSEEHAKQIAHDILNPLKDSTITVHLSVITSEV